MHGLATKDARTISQCIGCCKSALPVLALLPRLFTMLPQLLSVVVRSFKLSLEIRLESFLRTASRSLLSAVRTSAIIPLQYRSKAITRSFCCRKQISSLRHMLRQEGRALPVLHSWHCFTSSSALPRSPLLSMPSWEHRISRKHRSGGHVKCVKQTTALQKCTQFERGNCLQRRVP